MKNYINRCLPFLAVLILLAGCRKKQWDEKYGRPDTLEPPMYQVLDTRGNFKSLLALIDKAGYKETLNGSGYWTLFAPNDAAFDLYFKDKGISGVGGIDSTTARAMVQYWLVYNSFQKDRLDDYQATENNTGWTPDVAFRRRTAYYTGFYKDTAANNKEVVAIAANRNNISSSLNGNYITGDYNNKYISYFTDNYFASNSLTSADYKYFYPNSEYTGFNVAEAKVVNKDIIAENGVIHEVDKVITPLLSIDEYIRTRPEYSSFKAILNRLYTNNMVQFIYNADASHRYQVVSGKGDSVFVKAYSNLLAFSPNNENYLKIGDNDGQKDCWTMFIPNNQAVDAYVKNVLLQYYPSLDQMPIDIIVDFLNAHMFPTAVWPSKFNVTRNKFTEPARFDPYADVFDRKILSNGIIYGTTKVELADVFSTVFSKAYLHPQYSMMTRLFNVTGLRLLIAKSNVPVNIFLVSDKVFSDAGFSYNVSKDQFEYRSSPTASSTTNGVFDKLTRIAKTCVFFDPYKQQLDNLGDSDIVKSGDSGNEGDYIKYKRTGSQYFIQTGGLLDAGKLASVDSVKTASNGKVFYISDLPIYSEKPVGTHLKNLGTSTTSEYNMFWQYLSASTIYNATTTDIIGLTGFSTVFVPNNAAMKRAITAGLLPASPTSTAVKDIDLIRKFIQYHILFAHTVVPDGTTTGPFDTYLKDTEGNSTKIRVATNTRGAMTITDIKNRPANVILSLSNNLSNRSVIHLIDDYLNYNP